MPSALLRTPDRGSWLELRDPVATLTADRPDGVAAVLAGVEQATAQGLLAAGFVTYDAAAAFGLATRAPASGIPLAWFGLFPPARARTLDAIPASWHGPVPELTWTPSVDEAAYRAAVDRIREHIGAGDTYQLNYTFRLRAPFSGDPRPLFASLAAAQEGPWSAYIDTGTVAVCSASPELFFHRDGSRVTTRPMKGTTPRGRWADEDVAAAAALTASPKDRAENVMIVDLMRSDLGRLATPGSVRVTALCEAERYPAQWQMTSTVEAEVSAAVPLGEIFAALFPSGSVTGAPKVRSMQILSALEPDARGVYCGAIGLAEPGGRAHFNVAIRTITVDRAHGEASFGVGSGIVWDSDPAGEYEECRVKSAILQPPGEPWSLLESLRWEPGTGCSLLAHHEARLRRSAHYFGVPFDSAAFAAALTATCAGLTAPAKVRVLLDQAGQIRAEAQPIAPWPSPLRVALAREPISSQDRWLFHKTTRRAAYEAAEPAVPGADAVLLWNERGEVTESVHANVVVELDGRRRTPPVAAGLLAGTMRASLLEAGAIEEGVILVHDLHRATRLWLINAVRGWIDATLITHPPDAH